MARESKSKPPFKVGDKVRCHTSDEFDNYSVGDEFTITAMDWYSNHWWISWEKDADEGEEYAKHFELAPSTDKKKKSKKIKETDKSNGWGIF